MDKSREESRIVHPKKSVQMGFRSNDSLRIYREYDSSHNLIVKAYRHDTVSMEYDRFGFEVLRISFNKDSILHFYERNDCEKIVKSTMVSGNDTSITRYNYNKDGNLTQILPNGIIYEQLFYDSIGRILRVEQFRNSGARLSNVITYEYIKKCVVQVEQCSYDKTGVRYNYPCEKSIGTLNRQRNLVKLYQVEFYGDKPTVSTSKIIYNRKQQVRKIVNTISGKKQTLKYFYNKQGHLVLFQNFDSKELLYQTETIILK